MNSKKLKKLEVARLAELKDVSLDSVSGGRGRGRRGGGGGNREIACLKVPGHVSLPFCK